MILNENSQEVQTNATNKTKEFTIKTTAKAFKILSGGLYSDRIKAIIRELSCNAWDAHREAHNTKPFTVHLPNKLEPWFSVRDYGIGLSEENVMNLYSTYFESTKTETNKQVGALGLGSKSPFSYTDSFNVISIFDGTSKSYTAFIDESGTPSIVKIHEEESDEHNGLEVKFAVDEQDFRPFAEKAGVVFRVFKTAPLVIGNENFERYRQTLNTVIEGNGWRYCTTNFYTSENARAIQGNIEYPIDKNQLGDLTEEQKVIVDGLFYIDFNIGDLDISASRESLGYDETTVENIRTALTRVYNSFVRKVNKEIQAADTFWNAITKARYIVDNIRLPHYSYNKIKLSWGGREFSLRSELEYKFSELYGRNGDDSLNFEVFDKNLHIDVFCRQINHRRVSKLDSFEAINGKTIVFRIVPDNKNVCFIVYDNHKIESVHKAKQKARQYATENRGKRIIFLNEYNDSFFDAMGNPPYVKTSSIELEKSPSKPRTYPQNYRIFSGNKINHHFSYNEIQNYTGVKKNFYLVSVRDDIRDLEENNVSGYLARETFKILKENKIIGKNAQLFVVKRAETKTKRFQDLNWKPFYPWATDKFTKFFYKNYDSFEESIQKRNIDEFISSMGWKFDRILKNENIDDFLPNSFFRKIIEDYRSQKPVDEKHERIVKVAREFNLKIKDKRFNETYPMVRLTSSWMISSNWDDIKAYIKLVDSVKGEDV